MLLHSDGRHVELSPGHSGVDELTAADSSALEHVQLGHACKHKNAPFIAWSNMVVVNLAASLYRLLQPSPKAAMY